MRKHATWFGAAAVALFAVVVVSCGGTGGGGGHGGNPAAQFVLNSNNSGRLILNVHPLEVDANKSDRIGLVATLTDSLGNPITGVVITFTSDIGDISFIPGQNANDINFGQAVTDSQGNADIIAVAGTSPTGTGDIIGTGAIFAEPPAAFGLRAQAQVTLLDVGFIDAEALAVIPSGIDLVEPRAGQVVFFNIVGGTPPYLLKNEESGIGTATLSQHCAPGCTENSDNVPGLCIGSPCQSDEDCNEDGSPVPDDVCIGPLSRCLASCQGTNCAGSRCETDEDCNDGSPTPADVCKDSGQSMAYIIGEGIGSVGGGQDGKATHGFTVEDSAGGSVTVTVTASFLCGNGEARGSESCDIADVSDDICVSLGLDPGCQLGDVACLDLGFQGGGTVLCSDECKFDTQNCVALPATPTPVSTPVATSTP